MAHPVVHPSPCAADISILERNLESLRRENAALADRFAAMVPGGDDPDYPGWRFETRPARNGQPTQFAIGDGEEIALHSKYDPAREAGDQVRGALGDGKRDYFVILGFGLGYVVEALADEVGDDVKILVIEPHFAAFRQALAARDLSGILGDPRVVLVFGSRTEDGLAAFMKRYNMADARGIGFIELPARKRLPSAQFFAAFIERLKGILVTSGGNLQTLMVMAWQYQRNTMQSIGRVVDHPPVRTLFGAFEGKPAIIVSAGPSLEKNIGQLKALRDRVVLVAVDTAVRPLLAAGVEPHLVCTGDPQEANWRHLRGTETTEARLVAEPMTYPASLEHFEGRLFIASYGDKVMQWLSRHISDVGYVMCWGSVATMAFDLARKMGCDPIVFIGQDLSFPGGRTYVKGTYFEDEEGQDMSVEAFERNHVTYLMTDIHGEQVKTNRQMFAYKEWFRVEFGKTEARVINATEGGILKDDCEIMPLEEAARCCLGEEFDAMAQIGTAGENFEGYDLDPLLKGLFETIGSIRRCIDICEKGTNRVVEAGRAIEGMDALPPMWCQQVIKDLDALRFKLRDEPAMKDFLEVANQTGVLNFRRAYKAINGKAFTRVIFQQVLDLFTDLYVSTGRTSRGVLPFFVLGFKTLAQRSDAGTIRKEELCLKET